MNNYNIKRRKKYRIKSKFRFITSIVVLTILSVSAFGIFSGLNNSEALTKTQHKQIQIASGDTLWQIADKYKDNNTDTRKAIYKICQLNNIEASDLYPGMIISVPEDL